MTAMPNDAYGLAVTTSSDALATYDRAVRALLGWQADALDLFRAATALDPGLALAHAGAAVCLFLEERFAETKAAGEAARAAAAGQTERERSHVEALTLWTSGRVARGGDGDARPPGGVSARRDGRAAPLLRLLLAGQLPRDAADERGDAAALSRESFMLGLHAFALEEGGRCAEAVRTAEAALT